MVMIVATCEELDELVLQELEAAANADDPISRNAHLDLASAFATFAQRRRESIEPVVPVSGSMRSSNAL